MNTGIVLQSQRTSSLRLIVFDAAQGKIPVYLRDYALHKHAPCGGLLEYTYTTWRDTLFLETIDLKSLPAAGTPASVYFIHKIFEILLAFVPVAQPLPDLFSTVLRVYETPTAAWFTQRFHEQIFLCHVLAQLGVYPDEKTYLREQEVRRLILSPFEFMVDNDDIRMQHIVDMWLQECLASHPHIHSWRTLQ